MVLFASFRPRSPVRELGRREAESDLLPSLAGRLRPNIPAKRGLSDFYPDECLGSYFTYLLSSGFIYSFIFGCFHENMLGLQGA